MSGKCLIISGGEYSALPDGLMEKLFSDECCSGRTPYIIACDKGYEYASRMGLKPDLIVGDMDSYAGLLPDDIEIIRLPVIKDVTDTYYAVDLALDKGFDDIVIACATGLRFDHSFGNIAAGAYIARRGGHAMIAGAHETIYIFRDSATFSGQPGRTFSVFSLTEKFDGSDLSFTFPIGVSNEWEEGDVTVSCESGILMAVITF